MKSSATVLLASLVFACLPGAASAAPLIAQNLAWIAGCWASVHGDERSEEVWLPAADDGLIGVSRRLQQGQTKEYKFLRIVIDADGARYLASASGQLKTEFPLRSSTEREVIFENDQHDYPSRIEYRSPSPDSLITTISGSGGANRQVLQLQRAACDPRSAAAVIALPPRPANVQASADVVVTYKEKYSDSGCSLGLFKGTPPGKWKDHQGWDDLESGMLMTEVEALLGVEHYDVKGSNGVIWQYGKCGPSTAGQVLFENARVSSWRRPEF